MNERGRPEFLGLRPSWQPRGGSRLGYDHCPFADLCRSHANLACTAEARPLMRMAIIICTSGYDARCYPVFAQLAERAGYIPEGPRL